jgi:hypothetical protein
MHRGMSGGYKVLVRKPEQKRLLGKPASIDHNRTDIKRYSM